jgi:hypothetical protein
MWRDRSSCFSRVHHLSHEVGEVEERSDAGEGVAANPCMLPHPHPALRAASIRFAARPRTRER